MQGLLEESFAKILQEKIRLIGAGRTDSGVHAFGQVAHFVSATSLNEQILLKAFNSVLPPEVAVLDLKEVPANFHANRQALYKIYCYWILISPKPWPFLAPFTWRRYGDYDLKAVMACLKKIEGRQDFKAFAAADGAAKTSVRNLILAQVEEKKLSEAFSAFGGYFNIPFSINQNSPAFAGEDKLLCFTFKGEGFLKHMIRNIIGTLVDVAWGRTSVEEFERILKSRDRRQAGRTAPARGLGLVEVGYG